MELVTGGDLFSLVSGLEGGIVAVEAMRLFLAEISLALEYVHGQGLVFRDLKLENILVDEEGHIRLSDFGMAVLKDDIGEKEIVGTPEYFAPGKERRDGFRT
jgi:serine/threonine protein kinase